VDVLTTTPIFLGTTLACGILAVLGCFRLQEPGAIAMLTGGAFYLIGMFVVTMVFNVPLNDSLAAVDPSGSGAAPVWAGYLRDWTFWNHVRTVASGAASILFTIAIAAS
jgi:uncharacterized membrane protein